MDGTVGATRERPEAGPPMIPRPPRGRFWRRWRKQKFSREMMLRARIDAIRVGPRLGPDSDRSEAAVRHAEVASDALGREEYERAWRNILAGERLMLEASKDDQIAARASALKAEAMAMLPTADAKPVIEILSNIKDGEPRPKGWRDMVNEAQFVFERRLIYLNDTKERTAFRITLLIAFMSVFIAAFVALLWASPDLLDKLYNPAKAAAAEATAMTMPMLLGTFILGGLGACLSALLSFTSLGRVPGTFESPWVTFSRPVVGAVSGLVAVMLVRASLIEFKNAAAIGLVAFLFGFSERLVIGAVQHLEPAQKA